MYASMFPTAGTASIAPAALFGVTRAVEDTVIDVPSNGGERPVEKMLALMRREC
jgi:hypothetical protein